MKVSVVVCTYSLDLVPDTIECINSLLAQDYPDKEILLVMDQNKKLYEILRNSVPDSVKIVINKTPGLSSARNTGIKHAFGDIIAFIDDDATAAPGFLINLMKNYEDPSVVGVGGKILPKGKPAYPEELYWIGGFTYKGYPEERCSVRNVLGCNMSFRKEVFDKVGLFNESFGRTGRKLVTAEETEFAIRIRNHGLNFKIIYDPSILVFHKVHQYRQNLKYAIKRGYHEGKSKMEIKRILDNNYSKMVENNYLKYLFSKSIPDRVDKVLLLNDFKINLFDLIWLISVISSVGIGYSLGKMTLLKQDKLHEVAS